MPKLLNRFNRLLTAPARRLRHARPGSVLILVVALLVLLAMIGTAYISTTRAERYTSLQNTANTQADLLLDGLVSIVKGNIAASLFGVTSTGGRTYRPPLQQSTVSGTPDSYVHYTSTNTDVYLGDRLPGSSSQTLTWWRGFGWPLLPDSSGNYAFDIVDATTGMPTQLTLGKIAKKHDYQAYIRSKVVNGQVMPAFVIYDNSTAAATAPWLTPSGNALGEVPQCTFLAGDADGDGIADSGLWKLPVGETAGVTYYAAVRVIDNNSAVNASSADSALTPNGADLAQGLALFRSGVGLREMLSTPGIGAPSKVAEMNALNRYRVFNNPANLIASPSDPGFTFTAATATPIDDTPAARGDMAYYSFGDALDQQLTRRSANPGINAGTQRYQWAGLSESSTLASRFCLASASGNRSVLEQSLPNELLVWNYLGGSPLVRTQPYAASQYGGFAAPGTWYSDNFDFASGTDKPLRALLTADNPVSNAVAGHYNAKGEWTAGTSYHFGDWVQLGAKGYRFVCIQDHVAAAGTNDPTAQMAINTWTQKQPAGGAALSLAGDPYWAFVPWTDVPVKTNANTGTFGQLWAAYRNVMYDHPSLAATPTVYALPQPAFGYPRYTGDTLGTNQARNQENQGGPGNPPLARMFRSSIRDPNGATATQYLTPGQMMLLRSALAALNTRSLRAASGSNSPATALDNVISREIMIPADPNNDAASKAYRVMLFGATKQPYITDVWVSFSGVDTIQGIAIELSNPYPTAMPLTNWQIARVDRTTTGYGTAVPSMLVSAANAFALPVGASIPAALNGSPGKLVLTDGNLPLGLVATNTAQVTFLASPGLKPATAITQMEWIVMRPRSAAGTPAASIDLANPYSELTNNLADYVPVDQIDMTAVAALAGDYVYRRATDPTGGTAWHFVYSGGYSVTNNALHPYAYRHQGFMVLPNGTNDNSFGTDKVVFTGVPASGAGAFSATFRTVPAQIAGIDCAGWNQINTNNAKQSFPFGGFARNGDLLQVPFVGAYRIVLGTVTGAVTATTPIVEMNSLPMDSALADDEDPADDTLITDAAGATAPAQLREQIGRFCPVGTPNLAAPAGMDFEAPVFVPAGITNANNDWRYHWAQSLFDFITVHSPDNDYLPGADPLAYPVATPVKGVPNKDPAIVNAQTPGKSEDTAGVQGLININTAPRKVLAALPWLPPPPGYTEPNSITADSLAAAIVYYRELPTSKPFQSIYDLYKVTDAANTLLFKQAADNLAVHAQQTAATQAESGDFSPYSSAAVKDFVKYDFEKRFLLLNRVSNLITTRSDSFTCYVQLQGWRGVGTSTPTLVVQRRSAFILDRTSVTPSNVQPNLFKVPTN